MDNVKCRIPIASDTEFLVHNYVEGRVENSFVFLRTGEIENDSLSGAYQNGTIFVNTNSALLNGTFRINLALASEYPECTSNSTLNSLRSFILEPGMRFYSYNNSVIIAIISIYRY